MKPGYKKKATTSKKKIAKQKRKEAKQSDVMSVATTVVLDFDEGEAMGIRSFSFIETWIHEESRTCRLISGATSCWSSAMLSLLHTDVDEGVTKALSRREKKKREVLAVKTQKLKADILKKTTCALFSIFTAWLLSPHWLCKSSANGRQVGVGKKNMYS
jgi:hypothetical protein